MKKTLIIGGSIIIILLLILLWGYLFVFGTPQSTNEVYTNLGFSQSRESEDITPEPNESLAEVDAEETSDLYSPPPLRQITTEPVIGFQPIIPTSTSSPATLLYATADAGHVFMYTSRTGERERLSNISIARASEAHFSPDGEWGVIIAQTAPDAESAGLAATIIDLQNNGSTATSSSATTTETDSIQTTREILFDEGWYDNFSISHEAELFYTVTNNGLTLGRVLNLRSNTERTLFVVPFSEVKVLWGTDSSDDHYVYNSPAPGLHSYLYRTGPDGLSRLLAEGPELSVVREGNKLAYSTWGDQVLRPAAYEDGLQERPRPLALNLIREKCTIHNTMILCGQDTVEAFDLHQWYMGSVRYNDQIFAVDTDNPRSSYRVIDLFESGRMVDVIHLISDTTHDILYFQNKRDGMLWLYEIE